LGEFNVGEASAFQVDAYQKQRKGLFYARRQHIVQLTFTFKRLGSGFNDKHKFASDILAGKVTGFWIIQQR